MSRTTFLIVGLVAWMSAPALGQTISHDVNDMKYFYYPNPGSKIEIVYNDADSLAASGLKAATKTVIVIDGFLSDSTSPMSVISKDLMSGGGAVNIVVIDWGKLSGSGLTLGNPIATANAYLAALKNVEPVGVRLAEFIQWLNANKQIAFDQVDIIGHSLGAHISGACGRVINAAGFAIARVTGLDPAGSFLGMGVEASKRLKKGDASFVDIYHTNQGTLGDATHDSADVNVYANGGKSQPGCEEADQSGFVGYCSHSYSWQLFFSAYDDHTITACPCEGNDCTCGTCSFQCDDSILLGPSSPTSARGRYHISHGSLAEAFPTS